MKGKVTLIFWHDSSGEVIGEVKSAEGEVIATRKLGNMTQKEFLKLLNHLTKKFPGTIEFDPIEISNN